MNETSHYLPFLILTRRLSHPTSTFCHPSCSLPHSVSPLVTGEEEDEEDAEEGGGGGGAGRGGLNKGFIEKERREEKWWDDVWNNVCHGGDV